MAFAKINSLELNHVGILNLRPRYLMDEGYTAGGTLRRDFLAYKRVWQIDLSGMPQTDREAALSAISAITGSMSFWLDEFGSQANTISAFVTIQGSGRTPRRADGGGIDFRAGGASLLVREA